VGNKILQLRRGSALENLDTVQGLVLAVHQSSVLVPCRAVQIQTDVDHDVHTLEEVKKYCIKKINPSITSMDTKKKPNSPYNKKE